MKIFFTTIHGTSFYFLGESNCQDFIWDHGFFHAPYSQFFSHSDIEKMDKGDRLEDSYLFQKIAS